MLFSIIIPVHNEEKYLRGCIDSLLLQTYQDFEVLLIENNSTDNSLKICKEYERLFLNKIRVFQTFDGKSGRARNKGIEHATGEYIMFVDSDDNLHLQCLEIFKRYIEEYPAGILIGNFHTYDLNNVSQYALNIFPSGIYQYDRQCNVNSFGIASKIYRREIIEKYQLTFTEGISFDDALFHIQYIIYSKDIFVIPNKVPLYNYYINDNSSVVGASLFQDNTKYLRLSLDLVEKYCNFTGHPTNNNPYLIFILQRCFRHSAYMLNQIGRYKSKKDFKINKHNIITSMEQVVLEYEFFKDEKVLKIWKDHIKYIKNGILTKIAIYFKTVLFAKYLRMAIRKWIVSNINYFPSKIFKRNII